MKTILYGIATIVLLLFIFLSCNQPISPNKEMIELLARFTKSNYSPQNPFCSEARMDYYSTALKTAINTRDSSSWQYLMSSTYLELGEEEKSVNIGEDLIKKVSAYGKGPAQLVMKSTAIAYLRLGERANCINDHSAASCIFPIAGRGIQANKTGSRKAIEIYKQILRNDPDDYESRWLLNIAYMTIGEYPQHVPSAFLINGLDSDTSTSIKPFIDMAINTGLNTNNMAGGSIIDDFNNDGYLDIVTSSWGLDQGMHYCRNNTNGTFSDASDSSGLKNFTGGLNIMQTDYNNDGLKDIFVLRGAWLRNFGNQPNSLLKNNGDGTFTDVTKKSGLLSFHPTQTATWADFNNDGWLDVFIGNESTSGIDKHHCELFINNKNGTFTEMAAKAGCAPALFVKGVTSGDYDNDNLVDIFISTLDGKKILLKNEGVKDNVIHFKDVSLEAGLGKNLTRTFTTWFWDYDNDGWLDILVSGYEYKESLAWYAAKEALNIPVGNSGKLFLFRNNHNGTFEEVSEKAGLNKIVFAMGANFGDIDNDGFLDMYLGTGNPVYQSLIPNKMFKNLSGHGFADVTSSARVGNLQKGHGVSFADLDNDGDEDVYIEMGGAYRGDAYQNSLYINPGQNNNHWINISLEGTKANKVAIGAKIKVTFAENGILRSVYRDVNSGGSFGSNPLVQHIGLGQAIVIKSIEIKWPGSLATQEIDNLVSDQNISIKEGSNSYAKYTLNKIDFTLAGKKTVGCAPL